MAWDQDNPNSSTRPGTKRKGNARSHFYFIKPGNKPSQISLLRFLLLFIVDEEDLCGIIVQNWLEKEQGWMFLNGYLRCQSTIPDVKSLTYSQSKWLICNLFFLQTDHRHQGIPTVHDRLRNLEAQTKSRTKIHRIYQVRACLFVTYKLCLCCRHIVRCTTRTKTEEGISKSLMSKCSPRWMSEG